MALHHTIIGLPASGKTTFLAALWHLVTSSEVASAFALEKLDGDLTHVNHIQNEWLHCRRATRTSTASHTVITMHLRESETGRVSTLSFPDLSGESFESQVTQRTTSEGFIEALDGDGGIMLFINPQHVNAGMSILDAAPIFEGEEGEVEEAAVTEWSPRQIPDQVKLVDILQFLDQPPFRTRHRRIALIISAWDLIDRRMTPDRWLEIEMPLLRQFLQHNTSLFSMRVYGVSAQGGVFDETTVDDLFKVTPSKRIRCISGEEESNDISGPVKWLTNGG